MYYGNEPCPGCNTPATERPRPEKKSLCPDCARYLAIGRAHEKQIEPHRKIFQHYHAFRHDTTNILLHKILKAIDNPNAEITPSNDGKRSIKECFGSNGVYYKIPHRCFEPIEAFFKQLDEHSMLIEKSLKSLPEKVEKAIAEERTRIYNEGVEMGRNLLLQLENGGLSMNDFYRQIPYHKT